MSKLLKSKFLLGVVAVAVMFVGVVAVSNTASAATCTITTTLRVGSKGDEVKCLQAAYSLTQDGNFGPKTKVAVIAWQKSVGLTADGVFGKASRTAWMGGAVSGNFPAGCSSASGFSTTMANTPCSGPVVTTTLPAGCKAGDLFSSTTAQPCTGGAVVAQTGPVTAMLATDNPASGTVVAPSSGFVFSKYTFTGSGTVTSLKITRIGISSNESIPNIYLYDGATRLTDGASLNSDNTATFNSTSGLFSVVGSKTISVIAEVVNTLTPYSIGLNLISVTSGGVISPVSIAGNIHYVAGVTTATVDFGTVTPTGGSIDPTKDVVVFNSSVAVGTRDVTFSRLAMRQIGSVNNGDIANFRLMIDGATVATVANLDSNGYATFTLATPKTLTTGTRVFKVLADVNGGSSRNFQFSIRNKTDLGLLDTQYNAGISATQSGSGTPNFPASPSAATSINSGSVTVEKASDSTSGNITVSGNDVVLAKYKLTTYGESLKIETLKAGFTYVNTGGGNGGGATLRNGRIIINGVQVGSTATLVAAGTTFTTNYTLAAGMPATLEIRADIYDNDGTGAIVATDTLVGTLLNSTNNTQRLSSLGYISVPAGNISGNTVTAASAASITMAKTSIYGAQTTAVPQTTSYKMASYTLSGNNVEDVNLDTVAVNFTSVTNATFAAADLTNVILKIDGVVIGSPKSTVAATGDSFSITKVLPKNGTMVLEIWANIGSTITAADSMMVEMTASGVGASSSVASTTATMVDGQVITANTGSITATQDASRPDAAINDDAGTKTMAAFKFVAITDSYNITDLTFTVADATTSSMMRLFDGSTEIASKSVTPAAGNTTFSGLSWMIPAGQTKILTVKLDLGAVGVGMGSTGASTLVTLTVGTATNGAGASAAITESNPAGTAQYTYKSIPTLTLGTLPTSSLAGTGAVNTLAKFTVSTDGTGTIAWNRFIFSLTKTSVPTIANGAAFELWDVTSGSTQIAGTATVRDTADAATCLATLVACRVQFVSTSEQQISGAKTYELRATVGGTVAVTDSITTRIVAPSVFAASVAYATVAAAGSFAETYAGYGTAASFIWSDVSASGHATTTTDWSNDFLVRSLPLNSQTLTK